MKVVLDTNILVSSLIIPASPPHQIYEAWRAGIFVLVTCDEQLDEFRRVTRYDKMRAYIEPAAAGTLFNELRNVAQHVGKLPRVQRSPDAGDDYLLALAQVADAEYLVTGDRSGLLALKRHGKTRIVTARQFSTGITPKARPRSRSR
jgi:putative PIN family toxin of toxin-antitoxin system